MVAADFREPVGLARAAALIAVTMWTIALKLIVGL
jgi:hypothetical protein